MQRYFSLLQDRPKNCYLRTHILYRLSSAVLILSLGTSLPWKLETEVSQSCKGLNWPRVTQQLCRLGEHRKLSNLIHYFLVKCPAATGKVHSAHGEELHLQILSFAVVGKQTLI